MAPLHDYQVSSPKDSLIGGPKLPSHHAFQPSHYDTSRTKHYSGVRVDEENQATASPQSSSTGWSQFPDKLSRVGTAKIQPKLSKSTSWALEIVSLMIATGAMIAMVVLLAQYDDQPLPKWPHDITFNAMIALLATLTVTALAVPLSNSFSQLKWIRFTTGAAPLADMEIFDDASRGTWGAALMLVKLRGG